MVKRHNQLTLMMLRAADLTTAAIAWGVAYGMRIAGGHLGLSRYPTPPFNDFVPSMCLSLVLVALLFGRFALYEPKRTKSLFAEMRDVARAVLTVWVITYVVTSFMRGAFISRLMMGSVLAAWVVLAILNRLGARATLRWFRRRGRNLRTAAIIGTGRIAQKLHHALRRNIWTGIAPHYFVDDPGRHDELLGLPILGPLDAIEKILSSRPVDIAFVAIPGDRYAQLTGVLDRLTVLNVDVRVVPDLLSFQFLKHDVGQLDDIPIIAMTHSPQHGWNSVAKRTFDVIASAIGIVALSIPMGIIALAIKLTGKGPVFYLQQRTSLGGKDFKIIKFRTMIDNAEQNTGPVWATRDDPRVTKTGRLLRRTSLDELPQLFNVLIGHMSLVGPRPERPELVERFRKNIPRYMLRHHVKAGLTGWAQVHGLRGSTSLRKRVQYDLHYIINWSIGLDLRILVMSLVSGLVHANAY